ncbi:MFS transporter [Mangrovicella endophytica]|uniref:MFS transporter n=1 Tax=Mangrovicella endophytica TaxID=2066697 RepID=UPI000C9EB787|nr:MFS transporter [Mangrovicella endophytica]
MSTEHVMRRGGEGVAAAGLGSLLTVLIATCCGALAANIYYAQPLIALIGDSVGMARASESAIVTVSQIGYAIGLLLLVPIGDVIDSRRLIIATMAANVLSLICMAAAPGAALLFAAMAIVGVTSAAAQMLVPLAASLAPPDARGRIVGNVMVGLLLGILLARPVASFLSGYVGWRGVFALSAGLITLLAFACLLWLPNRPTAPRQSYATLIASLGRLFVTQPVLRRRGFYHAAIFASFSMFWTGAPLILLRPPFELSSNGVALFALAGVLGVLAAPVAGRLADRGHSRRGTILAIATAIGAFAVAILGQSHIAALVAAGILIDLGAQANLVIGQREIYQLDPALRNRLNSIYMTMFFLGGAAGSALTSPVLESFGWPGLCILGMAFPAAALVYLFVSEPR